MSYTASAWSISNCTANGVPVDLASAFSTAVRASAGFDCLSSTLASQCPASTLLSPSSALRAQACGPPHQDFGIQRAFGEFLDKGVVRRASFGRFVQFFLSDAQSIEGLAAQRVLGLFFEHLRISRRGFGLFAARIERLATIVEPLA